MGATVICRSWAGDNSRARDEIPAMSTAVIIRELPKLTEADRRAIRGALLEIANENPDVALCNQAALQGAIMLDRMGDDDSRRQSR
jgi:hypothetical protein